MGKRHGHQNRLGFALRMCTVRYVGLFLEDPLAVPWSVIKHRLFGTFLRDHRAAAVRGKRGQNMQAHRDGSGGPGWFVQPGPQCRRALDDRYLDASDGVGRQSAENGREAMRVAAGDVVANRNLVNPPA
ncbi:DUF4158 domain-containing protein [Streptomyces sp. NEAU-Y11]|nr:DUF4158 domain-containing protein [Streptomyces sp. NEAU-Y11]